METTTDGTRNSATDTLRDVVVLGSGPSGLTAAIYAARAGLNPLVLGGINRGGQLMITTDVENFPGYRDPISGPALMKEIEQQAVRVGAVIPLADPSYPEDSSGEQAIEVNLSSRPFAIKTQLGNTYHARTLIIATGAKAKWLGLPAETALYNRGISACATCDGFFFKGKDVVVVGGGDTAMEEALYLTRLVNSVTVIHRRDTLRASKVMADRALNHEKIKFIWNTAIKDIYDPAQGKVTGVCLQNLLTDEESTFPTDAVFVAIGHEPVTDLFKGQLDLDQNGYIRVTHGMHTGIPGVFAAGDVHDTEYRQAITAAGMGCMAAMDAIRFLEAEDANAGH